MKKFIINSLIKYLLRLLFGRTAKKLVNKSKYLAEKDDLKPDLKFKIIKQEVKNAKSSWKHELSENGLNLAVELITAVAKKKL